MKISVPQCGVVGINEHHFLIRTPFETQIIVIFRKGQRTSRMHLPKRDADFQHPGTEPPAPMRRPTDLLQGPVLVRSYLVALLHHHPRIGSI